MINILLCDDHELVRKGLRQLLQDQPGFCVMADVSSGESLLRELRRMHPDVLILDIALPGRSGLEILKQVQELYPDIKVLILSMYPEEQFAIRMIKAGASGYLHKDCAPEILNEAIMTIARGEKYVSHQMMSILFSEVLTKNKGVPSHKNLSDREMEVLLQLGQGKNVTEIADSISLSVKTVSTYKSRIFEKLRLKSIADLTRYIDEHQLFQATASS